MSNSNVVKLVQPGTFSDQLTEVLRRGARCLLAQAVEAEVADFLGGHGERKTGDGRQRVVRHGHLPEREVLTGIGPVALRQPRVRDRAAAADDPGRIRFSSYSSGVGSLYAEDLIVKIEGAACTMIVSV